jgi:arylsulfatase A-like enzyme
LIVIDTLRADVLGPYGGADQLSPFVEQLAAEGVTCDTAISACPWTVPSMASLFCSYYPTAHKVVVSDDDVAAMNAGVQPKIQLLDDSFVTLAECFRDAGYETAGFVANPFLRAEYGFGQGFEHFDSNAANNLTPGSTVNEALLTWLRVRKSGRPLFVYIHFMDVHGPYRASSENLAPLLDAVERLPSRRPLTEAEYQQHNKFFGVMSVGLSPRERALARYAEYWGARYRAAVREMDGHLAALKSSLQQMGVWDPAYVIFTSDHGEALGEHYRWGHGFTAHHNQLQVPLILRYPQQLPAGKRIGGFVRLIDVMPTLCAQLGMRAPHGLQGESFLAALRGGTPVVGRTALGEGIKKGAEQKAFYAGSLRLHVFTEPPAVQLFDFVNDPREQTDLAAGRPQNVKSLIEQLERLGRQNLELAGRVDAGQAAFSAEQVRRLQTVGYLDGNGDAGAAAVPATRGSAPATQPGVAPATPEKTP